MAIENLVGLYVKDDDLYTQYREKMFPILQEYGGGFGYDFKIAEVLKSETSEFINRVFTIHFPNQEKMDSFFSNAQYLKIKEQYFSPSVGAVTAISKYKKEDNG